MRLITYTPSIATPVVAERSPSLYPSFSVRPDPAPHSLITYTFTKLHHEGDLTVRLFWLNDKATKFVIKKPVKSVIDFKTVAKKQGAFRPHGVAIY